MNRLSLALLLFAAIILAMLAAHVSAEPGCGVRRVNPCSYTDCKRPDTRRIA